MAVFAFIITYRLVDSLNTPIASTFHGTVPSTSTDPLADVLNSSNVLAPPLDGVTGDQIVSAFATFQLALPGSGLKTAPAAGSDSTRIGNLNYLTTPGDGITLPIGGYLESLITGRKVIPNTGATLTLSNVLTGVTPAPATWTDEDDNPIISFFRGSRGKRGLRRTIRADAQRPRSLG